MTTQSNHTDGSSQCFGCNYLVRIEDFLTGVRAQRLLDSLHRLIRQAIWIIKDILRWGQSLEF